MDAKQLPLDQTSSDSLAANGLRLGFVDGTDRDALAAWDEADYRGFHDRRPDSEAIDEHVAHTAHRRITGVWDAAIAEPEIPVGTVSSWVGALTVPGETAVDSWAISSVTVASTHRRRGIARALLEGELRTAAAAGVAVASLTVSEATIYGRYGFGPATQVGDLTIDTKRAGWAGPQASAASQDPRATGRIGFVALQTVADTCRDIVDRARLRTPGEFGLDDYLWGRLAGVYDDRDKRSASLRAVRYDDASGEPQGVVVYKLKENENDFTKHTVQIEYLAAATDEAYTAVWRFLIDLDLVATIRHDVASADEPVLWMLRDIRGAFTTLHDHHWLRVLDVPVALGARRYGSPGSLVLSVDDQLGFTDGTFRLDVADDGTARVTRTDASPDLSLDIATLSALYLGAYRTATFVHAARLVEHTPGSASVFDRLFRSPETPRLSFWY